MDTNLQTIFGKSNETHVEALLQELDNTQLSWLAGYLTAFSKLRSGEQNFSFQGNGHSDIASKSDVALLSDAETLVESTESPTVTVLFGSRTGNGESVAKKIKQQAESLAIAVELKDMNEYQASKIKDEQHLLVIVSTHGEGEPPLAAEDFYHFLHSKKAPNLASLKYSVLALGDKSYVHFCKTGKDIDSRLAELGAQRIADRADCDADFNAEASKWVDTVLAQVASTIGQVSVKKQQTTVSKAIPEVKTNGHVVAAAKAQVYNKQNPFPARLLDKVKLNGRGSEKETFHYELSLENSGITYEPGDALGVYGINPENTVNELIQALHLQADDEVKLENKTTTLKDALTRYFEISILSPEVIKKYNEFAQSAHLEQVMSDPLKLKDFVYGRDVVDLVTEFPAQIGITDLAAMLRKISPRLYSISSSNIATPDEVHLTVSAVRYNNGRFKQGVCSTFLADKIGDDDFVRVYVEKNPDFRMPKDPNVPIIMVGPGTGVAPYRAFLKHREATNATGKNWLFFGDRNFATDFLYQTELLQYHKKGLLTNLNVAFSRDTDKKVYVQHKMLENAKELFKWLEEGATFYICGDMQHMSKDVHNALLEIICNEGAMSKDKADEYVLALKKSRRYLTDVY